MVEWEMWKWKNVVMGIVGTVKWGMAKCEWEMWGGEAEM